MDADKQKLSNPCPVCNSQSYSWGTVSGQGLQYHGDDESFWKKNFTFGTELRARLCIECGNIQLFAGSPPRE